MAILKILIEPDPRLRQKSLPVEKVDDSIRKILDDMVETMHANDGMGLAAPQVNIHKRLFIMQEHPPSSPIFKFINPEIVWKSSGKILEREGCLSVPGYHNSVERAAEVEVAFLDDRGHPQKMRFKGYPAICIQHELDHLDGILFIDHLSPLKKMMALRKMAKVQS